LNPATNWRENTFFYKLEAARDGGSNRINSLEVFLVVPTL